MAFKCLRAAYVAQAYLIGYFGKRYSHVWCLTFGNEVSVVQTTADPGFHKV